MKLNEAGQCPECKRKPLTYKRDRRRVCIRCDRAFGLDSGEQIINWAWVRNAADEWQRTSLGATSAGLKPEEAE